MQRAQPVAAVIAAILCLSSGVYEATRRPPVGARAPVAAAALRPLRGLPIAAGTAVALLPPGPTGSRDWLKWFFEAAWQRPDLRWVLPVPGAAERYRNLVAVGIVGPGVGWRLVWRQGDVLLFTRQTS